MGRCSSDLQLCSIIPTPAPIVSLSRRDIGEDITPNIRGGDVIPEVVARASGLL